MLFDLRGKRRRLIQVVYLFLAVAFAGSSIIFFVGSGINAGSLFDILGQDGGSSSFDDEVKRYEKKLVQNPKNKAALLGLARAQFNAATSGDNFDQQNGLFTEGAVEPLKESTKAWERYLKLDPKKLSMEVANLEVRAYDGLQEYEMAADTQEVILETRPSSGGYGQLAKYAYLAKQTKKGDLAAERAIELAKKSEKKAVERQLDRMKKDIEQLHAEQAANEAPAQ